MTYLVEDLQESMDSGAIEVPDDFDCFEDFEEWLEEIDEIQD